MTLYEFNALSDDDRLARVWQQGTFLANRPIGRSFLCLYALSGFFVEIRYSQDLGEITACRSFRSTIPLESYLSRIELGTLLSA